MAFENNATLNARGLTLC